jgi:pantoate kinase
VIFINSSVFVPSHITGFFEIIHHSNPLKKGSKGAGLVLDKGVLTSISATDGSGNIKVVINGESDSKLASITCKTIELIKEYTPLDKTDLVVEHEFLIPVGTGFGVSAACALGTSLGLTRALNLPFTFNQAASIAHHAEIEMKSGLGDVIAEVTGGLVIRIKEGAPGLGITDRLIINKPYDEYYILSKTLGELETSEVIGDPRLRRKINQSGHKLFNKLLLKPDIKNFLELSRRFAEETTLMNPEIKELVDIWGEETLGASMAMLGNTAFAVSKTPDTSVEDVIVSKIDNSGCRFVQ